MQNCYSFSKFSNTNLLWQQKLPDATKTGRYISLPPAWQSSASGFSNRAIKPQWNFILQEPAVNSVYFWTDKPEQASQKLRFAIFRQTKSSGVLFLYASFWLPFCLACGTSSCTRLHQHSQCKHCCVQCLLPQCLQNLLEWQIQTSTGLRLYYPSIGLFLPYPSYCWHVTHDA